MSRYRTIAEPVRVEIDKIKGSRFIGIASPASTEEEATGAIEALRAEFADARHHCYAFRLGAGPDRFRYSDDGEPRGTGGPPLLRQIDGRDLRDVVVTVVRYFGGVKLGTGPLLRAYATAASAALDAARVVEVEVTRALRVEYDYALSGVVKAALSAHGLIPADERFGEAISILLKVPEARAQAVADDLVERTAGQAKVRMGGD